MNARMWIGVTLLAVLIMPAGGTGMSGSMSCQARNATEAYCVNHGGCPRDGICYFPDGGYCDLLSFYNGTCPGKGYYEEAIWMAEAYRFLYGDTGYYSSYSPYGSPTAGQYGSPYYYYYYPGSGGYAI